MVLSSSPLGGIIQATVNRSPIPGWVSEAWEVRQSGIEIDRRGAHLWTFRDGKAVRWRICATNVDPRRAPAQQLPVERAGAGAIVGVQLEMHEPAWRA